ncbi:DUF7919 family protein [Streptomyces adustus]
MFYEDLSAYAYSDADDIFGDPTTGVRFVSFRPAYERLNVGWLEAGRPWTRGRGPEGFTDKLLEILAAQQVNEMLGLHCCDLCGAAPFDSHPWFTPRPGHRCAAAGTGELRVPGPPGVAFAAPQLIGHYVADHGYLPPRTFRDAVLAFDPRQAAATSYPWTGFPWIPDGAELYDARVE